MKKNLVLLALLLVSFLGCGDPSDGNDGNQQTVCDARHIQCGANRHCEIHQPGVPVCVDDIMLGGTHTLVVMPSQGMLNGCPALELVAWDQNGGMRAGDFGEPLVVTGVQTYNWNGFIKVGARCGAQYYSFSWPAGGTAQSIGLASVRWDDAAVWEFADGEARLCADGDVENSGVKLYVPLPNDTANYSRCPLSISFVG